ncbi:recombinase RecT [Parvibaculaceae bacterium PLY_AMNH_Bact1]|nr:recombinase RecT [Parvibaculaceae bacterium PLY_AMNH_Bact1]
MATVEQIEDRIDKKKSQEIALTGLEGGGSLVAKDMSQAMEVAKMMSISGPMVGKPFRGNPGACLGIAMQAWRWEMDPYAVSQKAYEASGTIAYEAQLVASVINTRAPIKGRLKYEYTGTGSDLQCTVTGCFTDDPDTPHSVTSPKLTDIKPQNSPLWKNDPEQQISYYTVRNWARRYCPEVILGVYDIDEVQDFRGPDNARDITPKGDAPAAPKMEDFTSEDVVEVDPQETLDKLEAAESVEELTDIWTPIYEDGTLNLWRKSDLGLHKKICQTYNTRKSEFEVAAAEQPNAEEYFETAREAIDGFETLDDLNEWWDEETEPRALAGISSESSQHMALEALCMRKAKDLKTAEPEAEEEAAEGESTE